MTGGNNNSHSHSHCHGDDNEEERKEILGGEMNLAKFLSSNIGILTGFAIMFLLAFFEDKIKIQ